MTAVMAARVPSLMVRTGMSAVVIAMMVALNVGVKIKHALKECFDRTVAAARYAAVKTDARLGKSHLRTAADTAADQHLYPHIRKEACKSSMPLAQSVNNAGGKDFAILYLVYLKLLGVTEVLKYIFSFIRYRDFHFHISSATYYKYLKNSYRFYYITAIYKSQELGKFSHKYVFCLFIANKQAYRDE